MSTHNNSTAAQSDTDTVHQQSASDRGLPVHGFVRDHPLLVVAGGVTVGLLIGALFPRRTGKAIVKRSSAIADLVGAAAASFGEDAAHRAGTAGTQLRKGGHLLADRAEDWAAIALRSASAFAQSAAENISKASEAAAERAEKLGEAAVDHVGKAGHQASRHFNKAKPVAEAAATQAGRKVSNALMDLRARIIG